MRLVSAPARVPVIVLGDAELALQAMELPLPVEGLGGGRLVHRQRAALTRPARLFQRLGPRTVQLHDLGPMNQTGAGEADHVGLLLAPARQGRRPLLGAPRLVRGLTARDHAAIDETVDDRRQLARGDRNHGLVQQPETLHNPPLLDQQDALGLSRQGEQVRIAEALADRDSLGCGGDRRLVVTGSLTLEHQRHQQIALLDAVATLTVDQPPGTAEPTRRAPHLPSEGEVDADPERAAHRAQQFAAIQVSVMGTLQAAHVLVVATEHVRRRRQQLKVPRLQRPRLIGAGQRLVGVPPRPPRVRLTAACELVDAVHRTTPTGLIQGEEARMPVGKESLFRHHGRRRAAVAGTAAASVDMSQDRVDDHRDGRIGVLVAAVNPHAAGDLIAAAVAACLRAAQALPQLERDVVTIDPNRGRDHEAQRTRLVRGFHEDLVDLDLDAGCLEHFTDDVERRLEASVGPETTGAGGQIEQQEFDPQPVRGLSGVWAYFRFDGHLDILS